jgi:hypothetical protein
VLCLLLLKYLVLICTWSKCYVANNSVSPLRVSGVCLFGLTDENCLLNLFAMNLGLVKILSPNTAAFSAFGRTPLKRSVMNWMPADDLRVLASSNYSQHTHGISHFLTVLGGGA